MVDLLNKYIESVNPKVSVYLDIIENLSGECFFFDGQDLWNEAVQFPEGPFIDDAYLGMFEYKIIDCVTNAFPDALKSYGRDSKDMSISINGEKIKTVEQFFKVLLSGTLKKDGQVKSLPKSFKIAVENFSDEQIEVLASLIQNGLPEENFEIVADPKLSTEQMKVCGDPNFCVFQADNVKQGFLDGLPVEQVKFYANSLIHEDAMKLVRTGFSEGLSIEEIRDKFAQDLPSGLCFKFSKSEFDFFQLWEICYALNYWELAVCEINIFIDPKYTWGQMCKIFAVMGGGGV